MTFVLPVIELGLFLFAKKELPFVHMLWITDASSDREAGSVGACSPWVSELFVYGTQLRCLRELRWCRIFSPIPRMGPYLNPSNSSTLSI